MTLTQVNTYLSNLSINTGVRMRVNKAEDVLIDMTIFDCSVYPVKYISRTAMFNSLI